MGASSAFVLAVAPLIGAGLTCAACYAMGVFLIARLKLLLGRFEMVPLAFLLGAACLHLLIFGILTLKIGYRSVLIGSLMAVIALGFASRRPVPAKEPSESAGTKPGRFSKLATVLFAGISGAFAIYYFVNAWAPEISPDGSGYHLEIVARYVREHGFVPLTTNMYAWLSEGIELLFLPAFAIGRHSAAALVHFGFTCMLGWLIYAYGRRIGKPMIGAAAALLTIASPVVGITGSSAYIDVAVAAVVFSVFYWLEIWDTSRDFRLLIPIGLMAGYCYAVKYTAAVMLLYALGFVAWRARKLKPVLVVAACAGVMILPWVIKDVIYVHNPIAPFGNALFRNPFMFPLPEQEWLEYLRSYDVENKWTLPLEVTLWGVKTQGAIGAAFLATPFALLALRFRTGRRLLIPGFLFLAIYWTNVGARFLIPCLPFFSLALALALESAGPLLAVLVLTHVILCWPPMIVETPGLYGWHLARFPYKAALRRIPEDQYLRQMSPGYELARMIDQHVPAGERVFAPNGIPESYTSHEIVVSFQSGLGFTLKDFLDTAWIGDLQPNRVLLFRFPPRFLRRIRLFETARLIRPTQWSVNEVRFLGEGAELPRKPDWKLRAFPDPWNVQLAFDNSLVTRWRSWEQPSPGMYIDVDFGRPEAVDEVRVQTSSDTASDRVELQAMEQDRWVTIDQNPEARIVPPTESLMKEAMFEFNARGIHYLLLQKGDFDADIIRADPEAWGLTILGQTNVGTLYEVPH